MPSRVARFRRRQRNRWTRETLPPRVPVVADLGVVDITVEPLAMTFEMTNDTIAEASAVDVTITPMAVEVQKAYDLAVVEVSVETPTLGGEKVVDLGPPVDITVVPLLANAVSTNPDYVEITVTPYPLPKAVRVADLDLVDVEIEPNPITAGRIYDLEPVDIMTEAIGATAFIFDEGPIDIEVQVLPLTFGYSAEDTPARRGLVVLPRRQPTRVIAQEILSKKWLHWDLQVHNLTITHTLSGAQVISGEFPVEVKDYRDINLEPWGTWIHVEEDGFIRASGILQPASIDQGETLSFEAVGVSAYPHGIPYLGEYSVINTDPAQIVRDIWGHIQSFPDAKLGVEVRGATTVRFGTPKLETDNTSGPYELQWWNATDCGSEINTIAQETPFDYVEHSEWNADKTEVKHYIDIGFPRIGTRRTNLVLRQEENLLQAIGPEEVDGLYASQVLLLGAGEGRDKIKGYAGRILDNRIRRVRLIDDKTVQSLGRAISVSQAELERAQALTDVTEVTIKARHINAPLGSYTAGDELRVEALVPWAGMIKQWERVLSYTYSPDSEAVRLSLRRAESFTYGGSAV